MKYFTRNNILKTLGGVAVVGAVAYGVKAFLNSRS